jgi:hypothetical protein
VVGEDRGRHARMRTRKQMAVRYIHPW